MNAYLLTQAPLIGAFAILLFIASIRYQKTEFLSNIISIAALVGCAFTIWLVLPDEAEYFGGAIHITVLGKALANVCLALTVGGLLLSEKYLEKVHVSAIDWRMVVIALCMGMVNLCFAADLATLFISYELVSIPSYILAGFNHRDARSNEAGMKYLLLGVFASVLFLLGLSFIYGATGEIHLQAIRDHLAQATEEGLTSDLILAKVGMGFIIGAVFFKVAIAPLHSWLADVYQGTNLASLAIISSPVKVAVFGMLGMLLWGPFEPLASVWKPIIIFGALCSALMGNFQAILQTSLKRLIAFSAVVNGGFILFGILLNSASIVVFYLGSYGVMTLGSWAAMMAMGSKHADVDTLSDLTGLGRSRKGLALALTIILLSYAGIPLTSGFAAKFGILLEAFRPDADLPRFALCVLGISVVAGLVSFYFYFKIVRAMWIQKPLETTLQTQVQNQLQKTAGEMRWNYIFVLAISIVVILSLGMFIRLPGF